MIHFFNVETSLNNYQQSLIELLERQLENCKETNYSVNEISFYEYVKKNNSCPVQSEISLSYNSLMDRRYLF